LHDSEKQWRELFERNPVIYFTIDATATVPSVNSVCQRSHHLKRDEQGE
jgi:hypothetical protein